MASGFLQHVIFSPTSCKSATRSFSRNERTEWLSRDISISNSWTGQRLKIHSYRHRGYWYFGKGRENVNMLRFSKMVRAGDTVFEVGGHVGFISQYLAKLVGTEGRLVVFEPGFNNIPYIEANVGSLPNVTLVRAAASSKNGTAILYEDNLTGQNNSLIADFRTPEYTAKAQGLALIRTPHKVDLVTLDSYAEKHSLRPDFLKIGVEGAEYDVLLGAGNLLKHARGLMVEISLHRSEVLDILRQAGFTALNEGRGLEVFALKDLPRSEFARAGGQ